MYLYIRRAFFDMIYLNIRAIVVLSLLTATFFAYFNKNLPATINGKISSPAELLDSIKRLNEANSRIVDIRYPKITQGQANSSLFCRKPHGLHFVSHLFGRKELEIAEDDGTFWFWYRSFDPISVYYCDAAKLQDTRVRIEMRPCLMRGLFGMEAIPDDKITMTLTDEGLMASFVQNDLVREIGIHGGKIKTQRCYHNGELVVSMEVLEFQDASGSIPKKIRLNLHEEGKSFQIDMGKAVINSGEDKNMSMPPHLTKISLQDYPP